jgi:hypothetical protein
MAVDLVINIENTPGALARAAISDAGVYPQRRGLEALELDRGALSVWIAPQSAIRKRPARSGAATR